MKFLVITRPRTTTPPQGEEYNRLARLAHDWVEAQLASGAMDGIYNIVPRGGVAIVNAATAEDLMAGIQQYPFSPYLDYEIHPLLDRAAAARLMGLPSGQE